MRSMNTAITAMKANQEKLDVISNNIANSTTTAFKTSQVNFSDTLYQVAESATAPTSTSGGTNAKSIGLGAEVSSVNKDMTQGVMNSTGRTLDCAVDGDGYFVVAKGSASSKIGIAVTGTTNGVSGTAADTTVDATYFTRDGNFTVDEDGYLVTSSGLRVMGYRANGTFVDSDTAKVTLASGAVKTDDTSLAYSKTTLNPMVIPDSVNGEAVTKFEIGKDGVITATTSSGIYAIGQIAMAGFTNTEGLEDSGKNLLEQSTNSGTAVIRTSNSVKTTDTGYNSNSFGQVRSGYLEASNVDLTTEFANMITTTKAFQAASKMITNGQDLYDTIIGLVR